MGVFFSPPSQSMVALMLIMPLICRTLSMSNFSENRKINPHQVKIEGFSDVSRGFGLIRNSVEISFCDSELSLLILSVELWLSHRALNFLQSESRLEY
jgi:hypothetical protein